MVCEQEGNMLVSEEEFVYDSMRNPALIKVLASYNRARQADYIVQQWPTRGCKIKTLKNIYFPENNVPLWS